MMMMTMTPTTKPIFIYETLMSPKVVQILLGHHTPPATIPATLSGYSRHPVRNYVFPGTISHNPNSISGNNMAVHGRLLNCLSEKELNLFDWFEGDEYERRIVQVTTAEAATGDDDEEAITISRDVDDDVDESNLKIIDAQVYIWKQELISELELDEEWCYDTFCKEHLDWYLENTVIPCRKEMEELGMT